ncbi:hypothetical protein ABK040_014672 [Willaertia magna]
MYSTSTTLNKRNYVVAIDFGSSGCAVAYADILSGDTDPILIELQYNFPKAPTVVVLDNNEKKGQRVTEFGLDAINSLKRNPSNEIFEKFKMLLSLEVDDVKQMVIGSKGTKISLQRVIGETLSYIVNFTLKTLDERSDKTVRKSDILWVITVPAIWTWKAKETMRQAMVQYCGLSNDQIIEALEPECAAITCWLQGKTNVNKGNVMVIDIGGGTVDISVHNYEGKCNASQLKLKTQYQAQGGPYGGNNIDNMILKVVTDVLGVTSLKKDETYYQLCESIESEKKRFSVKFNKQSNDNILISMKEYKHLGYDIGRLVNNYNVTAPIIVKLDKANNLCIPYSEVYKMFLSILEPIVKLVHEMLYNLGKKNINVDTIYLAGGMAESTVVHDYIKKEIQKYYENTIVLTASKPQLAIIKGAIYYGLNQGLIQTRVSSYTYGISIDAPYDQRVHSMDRVRKNYAGHLYVPRCFLPIVLVEEVVGLNHEFKISAPPTSENQKDIQFDILQTKSRNPIYADEYGVTKLATVTIDLLDSLQVAVEDKIIEVKLMFGASEIWITAKSGEKEHNVRVSFETN